MLCFQGVRKCSKKIILDVTLWHPMRRPNKTSRNFRGRWQVELLQQGRLRWQFSKLFLEGKHSNFQGFHLGENWLFCYTLNPAYLCCQYGLGPNVSPGKRYTWLSTESPTLLGKTATMPPPSTSITTTLKHIFPPSAFLGNLDNCLLIYEHIMANRHDLFPYSGFHFI